MTKNGFCAALLSTQVTFPGLEFATANHLIEKSNKKDQGETRTLRAFSPGQRLLLLHSASFIFYPLA
jgi:hypothetical protein